MVNCYIKDKRSFSKAKPRVAVIGREFSPLSLNICQGVLRVPKPLREA